MMQFLNEEHTVANNAFKDELKGIDTVMRNLKSAIEWLFIFSMFRNSWNLKDLSTIINYTLNFIS